MKGLASDPFNLALLMMVVLGALLVARALGLM